MSSSAPALELEGVSRFYGGVRAVQDVTLRVGRGERLGLIGPNGAGKTTLVRLISGEVRPSRGSIRIEARDVTNLGLARRARLGMSRTFQITELFPSLSVAENLRLGGGLQSSSLADKEAYAESIARNCGVWDIYSETVASLGYGRQRQVELAVALMQKPQIMLLDEPAAGLDAADRARVADVVRALPGDMTTVLIEHDVDLVVSLCSRVICLAQGEIVADASPQDIVKDERVRELYLGGGKTG